jgi:hypothetical protein
MHNMDSSGNLFKKNLEKAYSNPGMTLNSDTMKDATKYKQSFKENDDEDKKETKYLDIQDMIPLLRKQLMKGTKVDQRQKKEKEQKDEVTEKWSEKYKKSIDCSNPKGFSQKAHCDGKKKETKEATGSGSSGAYSAPMFSGEEPDLNKIETKESPNGRMSPIGFSDEYIKKSNSEKKGVTEDLGRWFKEKWVDVSKKVDGKHPPCGRKDADGKSYPKCRPSKKVSSETPKIASSYDKDEKKAMTQQKRRAEKKDPKVGKGNKPTMTHYNESIKVREQVEKVEASEATGSGSSGGYESPAMWAKSTKKKDWGPSRKTQIPGGGFVKIKKKCTKFPYCNQGDINNVKISKNESVKNAIKQVASKIGISENTIITILEHEYEKMNKRNK